MLIAALLTAQVVQAGSMLTSRALNAARTTSMLHQIAASMLQG